MAMKELWTKELPEYHGGYFDFPPVHFYPKPAQKPPPPIFLGGSAKNVFKRVVEWADGWMPTKPSVEEIEQGRKALDGLAAQAGRDPASIEVVAFGRPGLFPRPGDHRRHVPGRSEPGGDTPRPKRRA